MKLKLAKQPDPSSEVYHLRKAGRSFDLIAAELNITSSDAVRMFRTFQTQLASGYSPDDREAMIQLELERLDYLQEQAWPLLQVDTLKAVDSILKIMGHRAKLMQLDVLDPKDAKQLTQILVVGDDAQSFKAALEAGRRQDDEGDRQEAL